MTWWMPDFQWHPFGKLPRNHQLKPGLTTFTVTFAMRLIDVHNFQLYEFFGSQIPERYAILSHTWGAAEVTFHEFQSATGSVRAKNGFKKIEYACNEARARGIAWAWVDTCYI